MKCPTCHSTVADDAAVCPQCDTVLDPSLLDASPPADDDEGPRTGTHAPPPRRPARPAGGKPTRPGAPKKKRPKRPGTGTAPRAAPAANKQPTAKRDWRDEISQDDWNQMATGPREEFVVDKGLDPDDVFAQAKGFIASLSSSDKLAFFGATVLWLSTFFPWKETVVEGEVLGMMSLGAVVFVLAFLALVAITVRARNSFESLNPIVPWVAQLGCIGFSVLWCLVYMRLSWDSTLARAPVGNYEMWTSKPTFGVILGFLSGVVAALGTVVGLKDVGGRR